MLRRHRFDETWVQTRAGQQLLKFPFGNNLTAKRVISVCTEVPAPIASTKEDSMHQFNRVGLVATGCLIVWLTMVSPMSAISNTHLVHPGDSIQAAVDAASPGDTVMVRAGTYRESVRIQTDGLTLRAQGSVTLEPSTYGAGECYLPGHVAGFCVVPADFDPTSGSYTRRIPLFHAYRTRCVSGSQWGVVQSSQA